MGLDICCQKKKEVYSFASDDEKEIIKIKYKSSNDFLFEDVEKKYNILCNIQLIDYVNLLENYSPETATLNNTLIIKTDFSYHEKSLSYIMNVDTFQSFIENKLFKISEIYALSGKNDLKLETFKDIFREIFKSLEFKLNQHYKEDANEKITKKILISLGVLYSNSDVVGKLKLLFDLFKNDKDKFVKSDELDKYLLSSFLICSYCILSARKKITSSNKDIPKMNEEDYMKCLKVSKLNDSENLLKIFNETFFDKEELNWSEFRKKFEQKKNGFQWILDPKGIRKMLEENDV